MELGHSVVSVDGRALESAEQFARATLGGGEAVLWLEMPTPAAAPPVSGVADAFRATAPHAKLVGMVEAEQGSMADAFRATALVGMQDVGRSSVAVVATAVEGAR